MSSQEPPALREELKSTTEVPSRVKKVLVLTSPKAGSGSGRDQVPRLLATLQNRCDALQTSSLDEFRTHVAQAHDDGELVVVAAGGDGTLALVAQNMPSSIPIVPMPMGTENLLARHFGFSCDASHVAETIFNGTSHSMDAGSANGKLFLVMATCGFDAEVVRAMHLTRSGHIRRYHYAKPIFRTLRKYRFPELTIRVNGQGPVSLSSRWAMVFNVPRYGGALNIEPDADESDGQLDLITFKNGGLLSGISYLAAIAFGRHRKRKDVERQQISSLTIESDSRVAYQLDGDYGGQLPLKIKVLPNRVRFLMPK